MWNGIIYDISDKKRSLKIVMKTNDKKLVFKILGYMIRKIGSTNAFSHFFCFVALSWETDENKDNKTIRIQEIF